MKFEELKIILKRLFKEYVQRHTKRILIALVLSLVVAGSTSGIAWLLDPAVKKIIKEQELLLDNKGRIIVRESGTEPIIRVMVESKEEAMINNICEKIVSSIEKSLQKKN